MQTPSYARYITAVTMMWVFVGIIVVGTLITFWVLSMTGVGYNPISMLPGFIITEVIIIALGTVVTQAPKQMAVIQAWKAAHE